jgi:hypothetical protein
LSSRGGERHHDLLVVVAELGGAQLLGQVQVAEDLVADAHGDAEEAVHRRMVRREPVRVGVFANVRKPDRVRIGDQEPQHAAAVRQVADLGVGRGVDAVGDEVDQLGAIGADHAQRAVSRAAQRARRLDDALQRAAQVEVGADADDRVQQGPQPFPAGHDLADPVEHLLE